VSNLQLPIAVVEIADIVVDCSDPERVAAFWAELLGRPVEARRRPYV
jgi:hypothetical protein